MLPQVERPSFPLLSTLLLLRAKSASAVDRSGSSASGGCLEMGGNLMYKSGSSLIFDDGLAAPHILGGRSTSCLREGRLRT
jgi:hypothetical protein